MIPAWIDQNEIDELRSLIKNIKVYNGDVKYWGSGKQAGINIICNPAGESGEIYNGPFKCVKASDTSVTVQGYNAAAKRYFRNYAILGTSQNEVAEVDVTGITSDCWIYIRVSYSSGYSLTIEGDSTLPAQSATEMFIPLAFVKCADSKISSIAQVQYGIVNFPGRVF